MHRQPPSPARSMNQNQADSEIPRQFNRRGKCSSQSFTLRRPVRGKAWTTRVVFDSLARDLESGRAWRGVGSVKKLLHL